jgi:hypothetical protein
MDSLAVHDVTDRGGDIVILAGDIDRGGRVYKFSNYPTLGISGDSDYAASGASLSSSFGIIGGSFLRPSASRSA